MYEYFKILKNLNMNQQAITATVIGESYFGEKAIIANSKEIYSSHSNGFLSRHSEQLCKIAESRIVTINGMKIFCEVLGCEKRLIICGGGHISIPIIKIGNMLDFKVTVLEDRPSFADIVRKAEADIVICDQFIRGLQQIEGNKDTYFVIVTRGHKYDQVCLEKIIYKENAYIGMIGSRARVKKVKEELIQKGIDKDRIEKVFTPIGLKINAETPSEIAVAIVAEIIKIKNETKQSEGYSKEIVNAVLNNYGQIGLAIATIISKKGSAPRQVGAKMLVLENGTIIGTIGGGCVESDIIQKALQVIKNKKSIIYSVDLTGQYVEDEGMFCGGKVDILIEGI